jgi:hypothetical protein
VTTFETKQGTIELVDFKPRNGIADLVRLVRCVRETRHGPLFHDRSPRNGALSSAVYPRSAPQSSALPSFVSFSVWLQHKIAVN